MKIKLAIHAFPVMAALVCRYPDAKAQSCSSTTGAANASSFSTTAYAGSSFTWSNPANAQLSDGSYATAGIALGAFTTAYSDYLVVQNFGFSIPSTATICEIIVDVQRSASGLGLGAGVADQSVRLLQNGALYGNDLAAPAVAWPASDGTVTYGNALLAGTWGGAWQPSDVNNPNFGVAISAKLNTGIVGLFMHGKINQIRVTVIYDPNTILGINLGNFSGAPNGDGNLLKWTAATTGGSRFIIQRSTDSRNWQDIGNVAGDGSMSSYAFIDHAPLEGGNFYRLHMMNTEGRSAYSTISEVIRDTKMAIRCWPNPFVHTINITSPQPIGRVVVKDVQGRTLYMTQTAAPTGDWEIPGDGLPPGLYFVQVGAQTFRMLKQVN